jgi:hypothetical protein
MRQRSSRGWSQGKTTLADRISRFTGGMTLTTGQSAPYRIPRVTVTCFLPGAEARDPHTEGIR